MRTPIYMDHHATTPVDPRVVQALLPFFTDKFGNAASRNHSFGWEAEKAVEQARQQVADLIAAAPRDIIFTSGATESNNLALKGAAEAQAARGNHVVTAATEHKAVLDACRRLEKQGFLVTYLPVERDGRINLRRLEQALTGRTILISVMYANNEIGVLQPIDEIGRLARQRGILFHSDAAQAAGKVPIDVEAAAIDLLSLSGHKMYGPKGIGALYVRRKNPRVQLAAQIDGGGHERGLRSGTLNVPGIVGLGKACQIAAQEMPEESRRLAALRDRLQDGILAGLDQCLVNGSMEHRLPHNLNMSFARVEGEVLLMGLDDVAVSSGAACTSAVPEPSHVLRALGLGEDQAHSSIRFGLGRFNTVEEVDYVIRRVVELVRRLRDLSPAASPQPVQAGR